MNNENTKKFNIEYVFHNKNIRAFNYRNTIISYRKNLFPRLDIHKYIIFSSFIDFSFYKFFGIFLANGTIHYYLKTQY